MNKPAFKQSFTDPIWRCGVLEIRDVKKDGGDWARNGYDPQFRYNLWVGHEVVAVNGSDSRVAIQKWALSHYDPATGKEI